MLTRTRTTHVKEFKACRLSWRYTAVEQVPRARKDSFEFGTLVHRELEVWWLYGHTPQRPAALAVLAKLEPWLLERGIVRGEGRAEWNFKVEVNGVVYGGQSDLVLVTNDGRVLVLDYKTSIDIDKYCLTDYQLANDLQLGVYASRVLDQLAPTAPGAIVAHVQIASRDNMDRMHDDAGFEPRVEIVHAWMSREKAWEIWDGAEAIVGQMIETAELPLADVPGNRDQCGEYGGCAYRTRCHVYAQGKQGQDEWLPTRRDCAATQHRHVPDADRVIHRADGHAGADGARARPALGTDRRGAGDWRPQPAPAGAAHRPHPGPIASGGGDRAARAAVQHGAVRRRTRARGGQARRRAVERHGAGRQHDPVRQRGHRVPAAPCGRRPAAQPLNQRRSK